MTDLVHAGARELARRIRAREVSAREVTQAFLDRIATHDGAIGAYLRVTPERACRDAEAIDATIARGDDPGPLAGVPVGVKDVIVTEGIETTAGSKILAGWIPPYQATAVARLRAAGAIVLGKLNCDEFAMGSSNEHAAYRACRNPWDLTRVPGGSSGGSAAAIAAGLAAITLAQTPGDRSASRRRSAASSAGSRPTAGCRAGARSRSHRRSIRLGRWPRRSATPRSRSR